LGAQCQTIKQNQQCYPFTTLSKLSSLLQGAQVPTSVKTTMCMSPLSGLAAGAGLIKGIACCSCLICDVKGWLKGCAKGGLVSAKGGGGIGCRSTRHLGGLPGGRK